MEPMQYFFIHSLACWLDLQWTDRVPVLQSWKSTSVTAVWAVAVVSVWADEVPAIIPKPSTPAAAAVVAIPMTRNMNPPLMPRPSRPGDSYRRKISAKHGVKAPCRTIRHECTVVWALDCQPMDAMSRMIDPQRTMAFWW